MLGEMRDYGKNDGGGPRPTPVEWSVRRVLRGLRGEVFSGTPLVPGAVIVGELGVAEPGQVEEDHGGGDAAIAVGHGGPVGHDPGLVDAAAELVEGMEAAFFREEEFAREVECAGDVTAARAAAAGAGVLAGIAGI